MGFSLVCGVVNVSAFGAVTAAPAISSKAIGAKPCPEVPKYVSTLDDWGDRYNFSESVKGSDWLHLGFQHRSRIENFDNFYRRPSLPSDWGYFGRHWFYLGIRDILDPFRFTVELEDSRREGFDNFPFSARQDNHTDFLQAYTELYFEDGLFGQPTSLQVGRFSFDAVDRRLIARNRFRNSANTFDGVRLRFGDDKSPWVATVFATRPVEARGGSFDDRSREERAFYGAYATLRSCSPALVLEPYYFYLDDERIPVRGRTLHTAGIHAYGAFGDGFDYDVTATAQWGELNGLDHFAYFFHGEIGRTFDHPWKPRVSAWLNYGSGDDDPNDDDSERFTELFGAPFGLYGFTRYFTAENTVSPVLGLSFKPTDDVKVELYLRSYSLASDTDAWVRGGRRDTTGSAAATSEKRLMCGCAGRPLTSYCLIPGLLISFPAVLWTKPESQRTALWSTSKRDSISRSFRSQFYFGSGRAAVGLVFSANQKNGSGKPEPFLLIIVERPFRRRAVSCGAPANYR
ncbi:alginate export family protein [bacterium]|nr:alginate export family protein [bacterium]